MEKNKLILYFYFGVHFLLCGQTKTSQQILSQISTEGEILGFVEHCQERTIRTQIPIIPPLLGDNKLKTSSKYGYRIHPIYHTLKFHAGIDMTTTTTDTIVVSADGVIEQVGYQSGLGNYIVVRHKFGFMTLYGHLKEVFVKPSQIIGVAQTIGLMGNTGMVTGKHLHYTIIKNGYYLNPFLMMYLFLRVPIDNRNSF